MKVTVLLALALALAACGKPPEPKVDAAAERAAATERAKRDVFGTQVKALESARALEADVQAKAGASVDAIEKNAR